MILFSVGALLLAYLLGSIPFGLLLTRAAGLGDLRSIGSGNIGATNVLRTGNKKLAILTLLLDAGKGAAAIAAALFLAPNVVQLAALIAVLGHMYPVWLKFKGGKGVATGLGVIAALNWPTGLIAFVLWLPLVFYTRISSLSTLIICAIIPFILAFLGHTDLVPVVTTIIALVIYKHRENIRRLINRTEPKFGAKKDAGPSPQQN